MTYKWGGRERLHNHKRGQGGADAPNAIPLDFSPAYLEQAMEEERIMAEALRNKAIKHEKRYTTETTLPRADRDTKSDPVDNWDGREEDEPTIRSKKLHARRRSLDSESERSAETDRNMMEEDGIDQELE